MRTYNNAANALANAKTIKGGEIGNDGYDSAYTELTGGAAEGNEFRGPCRTATDGQTQTPTVTWETTEA